MEAWPRRAEARLPTTRDKTAEIKKKNWCGAARATHLAFEQGEHLGKVLLVPVLICCERGAHGLALGKGFCKSASGRQRYSLERTQLYVEGSVTNKGRTVLPDVDNFVEATQLGGPEAQKLGVLGAQVDVLGGKREVLGKVLRLDLVLHTSQHCDAWVFTGSKKRIRKTTLRSS
jgi:hypothetical protein